MSMRELVLEASMLDEATEQRLVRENGGRGLIRPYKRFDPDAPPLVLVHGIQCSAEILAPLLDALAARTSRQPYVFVYDDTGRYLDRSGDDLARALDELRREHLNDKRPDVQLIAHSMGGVVARCALDSLADPAWFPEFHGKTSTGEPARVRGTEPEAVRGVRLERRLADEFRRVDLLTVDTPWHGFADPPIQVRHAMEAEASFVDMVSNAAVMNLVNTVALPRHFSVNHVEADNRAAGVDLDKVMGLGELSADDLALVVRFFGGDDGAIAGRRRIENQLRALRSEEDFPVLEERLRADAAAGLLTPARFLALAANAVPRVAGSHNSVLGNPELVDLIEETFLRSRRGG
jgi:pimeloyl-ACP methyl ester carboxylesterase